MMGQHLTKVLEPVIDKQMSIGAVEIGADGELVVYGKRPRDLIDWRIVVHVVIHPVV